MSEERLNELKDKNYIIYASPKGYGKTYYELEKLKQENQQLKEQLDKATRVAESEQIWANKCEDRCINYQSVLDEIREYIEECCWYPDLENFSSMTSYEVMELLQILDKVKK